jgi:hypothetical protein
MVRDFDAVTADDGCDWVVVFASHIDDMNDGS